MRPTLPTAFILTLALAGLVHAHGGTKDKTVLARMDAMLDSKKALNILGDMAKGLRPLDPDTAEQAKSALVALSRQTPDLFKTHAKDPTSEALPLIWENWDDFLKKNTATVRAAQAVDTKTLGGLQQSLIQLGATCLDCHEKYRKIKN